MSKQHIPLLGMVTLLFFGFLLGFSAGKFSRSGDVLISIPEKMHIEPTAVTYTSNETVSLDTIVFPININIADKEALMALPGIGEVLAVRILTFREVNGNFSHVTELMNVEGIGQTKLEAILDYVTTGG